MSAEEWNAQPIATEWHVVFDPVTAKFRPARSRLMEGMIVHEMCGHPVDTVREAATQLTVIHAELVVREAKALGVMG